MLTLTNSRLEVIYQLNIVQQVVMAELACLFMEPMNLENNGVGKSINVNAGVCQVQLETVFAMLRVRKDIVCSN